MEGPNPLASAADRISHPRRSQVKINSWTTPAMTLAKEGQASLVAGRSEPGPACRRRCTVTVGVNP